MFSDASEYACEVHGRRPIETRTVEGTIHRDTEANAAHGEADQQIGGEYE